MNLIFAIAIIFAANITIMSIFDVFVIAVALAMDCFSVSVATGVAVDRPKFRTVFIMALFFGGFQGLMPVIGWLTGGSMSSLIEAFDHWVALILLVFIGGNMIRGALSEDESKVLDVTKVRTLIELAVATSVDALVVGVNLGIMQNRLLVPALIIAAVSFVLTIAGFYLGAYFKRICKFKFELVGGIVLIGIGIKIFLEHTLG